MLAYYSTGRLWLKPKEDEVKPIAKGATLSVFAGYRDCFTARTSETEMNEWFFREFAAANAGQVGDAVLKAVKQAVLNCVPDAIGLAFDFLRKELVLEFSDDRRISFDALSDGQRTLAALSGDIARRAITLNPHLQEKCAVKTRGVVLIDELDLHLHPSWQRRVVADLKRTFPEIQFFATTHSPQIIGETPVDEILLLKQNGSWEHPAQSIGLDSSEILTDIMHAKIMSKDPARAFDELDQLMAAAEFEKARIRIDELRRSYGTLARLDGAEAYMARMEILADQ